MRKLKFHNSIIENPVFGNYILRKTTKSKSLKSKCVCVERCMFTHFLCGTLPYIIPLQSRYLAKHNICYCAVICKT